MKYYMTQRPPAPGAMPKAGLTDIDDFDEKRYIPQIHGLAWAVLTYNRELSEKEVRDYELTPEEYQIALTPDDIITIQSVLVASSKDASDQEADRLWRIFEKLDGFGAKRVLQDVQNRDKVKT